MSTLYKFNTFDTMPKISIRRKIKNYGKVSIIRDRILKNMPKEVLFTKSIEELCFYTLNKFNFKQNEINIHDVETIKKGCEVVLDLIEIETSKNSLKELLYYILEFSSLPGIERERLRDMVIMDLATINRYIQKYENIEYIKNKCNPRNHEQKTQIDFYNRCIEERIKIEKHLEERVEERAIEKARKDRTLNGFGPFIESYFDRPYITPMPYADYYFDSEKIDTVTHRILEIPIRIGSELKQKYRDNNKAGFYKELEKLIPIKLTLGKIQNGINWLPMISEQRKEIFKEIEKLYKGKKWYGFYALGLTQIEGLFSDMCELCGSKKTKALPDKVGFVKEYHEGKEKSFDYFQYHLPNLRNKFLHLGAELNEKIDILCKDIVYDLGEVVSIFLTLNIDAIHLLRLIRKRDVSDFVPIEGIVKYIKLVKSVKGNGHYYYFENEIQNMNETFLPGVIHDAAFDLDEKINELFERCIPIIKLSSNLNGFEVELYSINNKWIKENSNEIENALKEVFTYQLKYEIEEILFIWEFLTLYSNNLNFAFIESNVKDTLETLYLRHMPMLTKINLISMNINKTIGENKIKRAKKKPIFYMD